MQKFLEKHVPYLRQLKKRTKQQELLLLLVTNSNRTAGENKQLTALVRAEQARIKAAEENAKANEIIRQQEKKQRAAARTAENRKKILVGAFVIEQLQKEEQNPRGLQMGGFKFMDWLTRDTDKKLFE